MPDPSEHARLIERGLAIHEERAYADALPLLERTHALAPRCPSAIYNLANTLFMLDREREAYDLLRQIIDCDDEQLRKGCPDGPVSPASYKLDAYFLLFLVVLYGTEDWDDAFAYAQEHLRRRRRGLRSLWTRQQVLAEIRELRAGFAEHT